MKTVILPAITEGSLGNCLGTYPQFDLSPGYSLYEVKDQENLVIGTVICDVAEDAHIFELRDMDGNRTGKDVVIW